MENEELLGKIFKMQSESNERDARLEMQLQYLSGRMDKTENLLEKMSEVLNSQKHLSSVVNQLAIQLGNMNQRIENAEKKISELETKRMKTVSESISKITWIGVSVFITAICSYIISRFTK